LATAGVPDDLYQKGHAGRYKCPPVRDNTRHGRCEGCDVSGPVEMPNGLSRRNMKLQHALVQPKGTRISLTTTKTYMDRTHRMHLVRPAPMRRQ
jgi:hypothetical protein